MSGSPAKAGGVDSWVAFPELTPALRPIAALFGISSPPAAELANLQLKCLWGALINQRLDVGSDWAVLPEANLWAIHSTALARRGESCASGPSLLDVKAELALRLTSPCRLCQIRCLAERETGASGACGARSVDETRVTRVRRLVAEEPFLPEGFAVDLSGCQARCIFCHSAGSMFPQSGQRLSAAAMARHVDSLAEVQHLNLVGGEPTLNIAWLFRVLQQMRRHYPIVFTTNGLASPESITLLERVVSVYLLSMRASDECSAELGDVGTTRPFVALRAMAGQCEAVTVVRILLLPGHVNCCFRPIVNRLVDEHRNGVRFWVRLMDGYFPAYRARKRTTMNRTASIDEKATAAEYLAASTLRLA